MHLPLILYMIPKYTFLTHIIINQSKSYYIALIRKSLKSSHSLGDEQKIIDRMIL